jgi:uncharacterized protein (TIGR02145 family)
MKQTISYKNILILLSFFIFLNLVVSCKKDKPAETIIETGTVTDIDNNSYKTAKIGTKWWMAENLKVTKYRNGTPIVDGAYSSIWNTGAAAYCLYDNDSLSPGFLYNWNAVSSLDGLAPQGWHVATESDWQELEKHVGLPIEQVNQLNWREGGGIAYLLKLATGWAKYDTLWAENTSGFSAKGGGGRLFNGKWTSPGLYYTGFWWSSTENDFNTAWFREMDYKKSGVFRYYVPKTYGMNVRCVKD